MQGKFRSDLNERLKGNPNYKWKDQINTIKNVQKVYNGQENVLKFYNDYTWMVSDAKYKPIHGEGLKILTPKKMLQTLPIGLAQVKADNTSEN